MVNNGSLTQEVDDSQLNPIDLKQDERNRNLSCSLNEKMPSRKLAKTKFTWALMKYRVCLFLISSAARIVICEFKRADKQC